MAVKTVIVAAMTVVEMKEKKNKKNLDSIENDFQLIDIILVAGT
jgi:hypothetical protein